VKKTDVFADTFVDGNEFLDSFILITGYSSQPGHSKKLLRLIMNNLNVNQLLGLRNKLSKMKITKRFLDDQVDIFTDIDSNGSWTETTLKVSCASSATALEWVQGVETPFSLRRLARCAITRAMSRKCLFDVSTFDIPKCLEQYNLYC